MKYKAFRVPPELINDDLSKVSIPYNFGRNMPDGEYVFRGTKKGSRAEIWKLGEDWYLVYAETKDKLGILEEHVQYGLFPSLPHEEYLKMKRVRRMLAPIWKDNVYCYFRYLELREIDRSVKKDFLY